MRSKMALALLVVSLTVIINAARPTRARADDTAIIVIGSLAAFVGFIVVGTLLTRDKGLFSLQPTPDDLAKTDDRRATVRFGTACPLDVQHPSLACW